jgi:ATP-dependent protease ClpP protease subunit
MSVKRASKLHDELDLGGRVADAHHFDIDAEQRIIYLMGIEDHPDEDCLEPGIEYRTANRFIRNINVLSSLDANKPIIVCMKSCGGDWVEGMAIYDAILAAPNPVTILSYTHARSMTSIIFQAANKRIMMPYSTFMFHEGTYGDYGTVKSVRSAYEFSKISGEQMLDIYVDVMKTSLHGKARSWSRKRIREWLVDQMNQKEEVYMLAEEAIEWGFADNIFNGWSKVFDYTEEELLRK